MTAKPVAYEFHEIARCRMCSAPANEFRTLGMRRNRPHGLLPRRLTGVAVSIQRCRRCRLVFPNPLPIPQSIQQHYDLPAETYWSESYSENTDTFFETELLTYRSLFRPSGDGGAKALDIGAGIGRGMRALERHGFDVYGLEPSASFAQKAREKFGFSEDRFQLKAVEDASYPDDSFDFITFGAVLEHLYDPGAALARAVRWLRKDGLIHVEVPSSSWLVGRLANLYYRLTGTDYVAHVSPMHRPYHLYEFSTESFRLHGTEHGYEIAAHKIHVCETYLPPVVDPLLKLAMRVSNTGLQLVIWLRKTGERLAPVVDSDRNHPE